tara:strand:+ start:882 stop:1664 length:783 start_codon:yes stop_codon:yes gene_type:complete
MKIKITEKNLTKVRQIIKEELDKQLNGQDPALLCEQAKRRLAMNEGILSQIAAKAKGAAAKVAAAGGNIGTAAQMAVAAAKGDQEAVTGLAASLQNVDMAGQVKQAESLVKGFNEKIGAAYKDFAEDMTRAGFTGLPGIADVVEQIADSAEEILQNGSQKMMDALQNGIKEIEQVAKKTGADKAAEDDKKAGAGKDAPTTGQASSSGDSKGPTVASSGQADDSNTKDNKEDSGMMKALGKMASAAGLAESKNKHTKRRKR